MMCFFFFTLQFTISAALPVTSNFGWRFHPISGEWKFHTGVDLGYEQNTPIPSLFRGDVIAAGNENDGYGNCVLLYHEEIDSYTRYAHCAEIYVVPGQKVDVGDIIGLVGSTGISTGPHLHLEYITPTKDGYQYSDPLSLWS